MDYNTLEQDGANKFCLYLCTIFSAATTPLSPTLNLKTPLPFGNSSQLHVLASSSNSFSKDSPIKKRDVEREYPASPNISSSSPGQKNADKLAVFSKDNTISSSDRKKVEKIKEQLRKEREKNVFTSSPNISTPNVPDADSNEKRKFFPELPVSKCDGDKLEQHKDDFADTKKRLEEARARKMADNYRKKEIEK